MDKLLRIVRQALVILLVISYLDLSATREPCSTARRLRCRYGVLEELEVQSRSLSNHELEFHCNSLSDNLECLIWQISQCAEDDQVRERNGDLMKRASKYMKNVCNTFGGWWLNNCFLSKDVKACNRFFAGNGGHSTCSEYERFRVCLSDVVENKCEEEGSDTYFGTYLLDLTGDMVWKCPRQQTVESSSHAVSVKETVSVKSITSSNLLSQDSHLHNSFRSLPLTGDSPFVTGCNARSTEEMRGCLDRYQYQRDQSLGSTDSEDRLRKTCCATWNYRQCIQNAVRTHCYDTRQVDAEQAMDYIPHDRDYLCREHWIYRCSGASSLSSTITFLFLAVAFVRLRKYCDF